MSWSQNLKSGCVIQRKYQQTQKCRPNYVSDQLTDKLTVRSTEQRNAEMFFVTASLCSTLMFVGVFEFVSADQRNITTESGQDVTLPCRAPNNNIIVLEWTRAEYGANYVFLYRDGRFDPANQHPSFKNRVDLQDRQMKDGDVSLILKNVNTADTGTYKCGVFMRETRLWKNSIIYLTVVDPPGQTGGQEKDEDNKDRGKENGSVGLIVGLFLLCFLLLLPFLVF